MAVRVGAPSRLPPMPARRPDSAVVLVLWSPERRPPAVRSSSTPDRLGVVEVFTRLAQQVDHFMRTRRPVGVGFRHPRFRLCHTMGDRTHHPGVSTASPGDSRHPGQMRHPSGQRPHFDSWATSPQPRQRNSAHPVRWRATSDGIIMRSLGERPAGTLHWFNSLNRSVGALRAIDREPKSPSSRLAASS